MSVRVNMLRPEEVRYQGPVSRTFIILASTSVVALVFLVIAAFSIFHDMETRRDLRWAREEWQKADPRYKIFTDKQSRLDEFRGIQKELDQWSRTRLSWTTLLLELQTLVPTNVQLTRLSIRSDWSFVKPAAPAAPAAPPEGAPPAAPPAGDAATPKAKPAVPTMLAQMTLEGRAAGDLADEVVVQFVRTLRDANAHQPLLESVRLQHLQLDSAGGGAKAEKADRVFQIEARFLERKLE